jgi:drug/metabolite transporter (DMT)-like permease
LLLLALLLQASPAPFSGAGEVSAFSAAMVWGVATVLFTLAFRKGKAADAVLVKNLGGAVVLGLLAFLLAPDYGGGSADAESIRWLLLSGMIGLGLGDWLYFVALGHIGVGRTLILGQSLPVLTAFLAWFTHDEWLSAAQWGGVAAIVAGGLIAESRRKMRGHADGIGIAAAFGAVLAFAVGNGMMAEGVRETGAITGAAWRLVGGTIGILLVRTFAGELRAAIATITSPAPWKLFLLPSAVGTWFGMALLTGGFKWALQGVAAALAATTPLISIPLAVIFLHEKPGWRGWTGAILVVAGAALLALAAGGILEDAPVS